MTQKEHWYARLLLVFVLIVTMLLPVSATQIRNFPKAEAKYIRRVLTDNTVGQSFRTRFPSDSIDILVRSETTNLATLIAFDETGADLGRIEFTTGPEDEWVTIPFTNRLSAGQHTVTIATISGINLEKAILLRYQPLSSSYEDGNMIVNGADSYGDLAFRVKSHLPFWQSLLIGGKVDQDSLKITLALIIAGLVIGIMLWLLALIAPPAGRSASIYTALISLILLSIFIRLPVLANLEGVFGGDLFNYLSKAQAPLLGADPFAADPRKGPLFSALLIPGFFSADPVLWARWVSLLAAVGTIVLLVELTRRFNVPWGLAIGSGLFLAVNQDFIWESVNGLANTLYVAMITAALLSYLLANKRWAQWVLAIMCGLIFLTRFEGVTFAVILLGAMWWREKLPWRRALTLIAVSLAIMLIPQISIFWSGQSGIRSLEDVNTDAGLFVVRSYDDLVNNVGRFNRFLTSAWLLPKVGQDRFIWPGFIIGLIGGAITSWSRSKWPEISRGYRLIIGIFLLLGLTGLILLNSSAAKEYLIALPWLLIGLGIIPWWRRRPFDATVIFTALLIQTVIILLILPKPRYFLPLIPYFSLLMTFGVLTLLRWKNNRRAWLIPLAVIGILASFFYVDGRNTVQDRLEHHNLKAEAVTPMLEAMKYLRGQEKRVGLKVDLEQAVTTYLPDKYRYHFSHKTTEPTAIAREELNWIHENEISFLVERNNEYIWQSARKYPDIIELRRRYGTNFSDSRVLVYLVNRDKLKDFLEN